ncbi:MAG: alanine--tRNA ligase [Dehalococcoidia bacterium]|nr:alanine--tRNA ligase [Dehalococcoidia bacterium]
MPEPKSIDEIRDSYLKFFESKKHLVVPSSSLVPVGDPTLLLTTAGMVQFKSYFTGEQTPPNPRLASCQKCFRTTDIDSVGDIKHLTFFEMLGNFSIGNYFKKEAIEWAWEFVTGVLKLSPNNLWITYYKEGNDEDLEARAFWIEATKGRLPESHIVPLGRKYNWWGPAGEEGPCGPCSEIHYSFDLANTTLEDLTGDSSRAVEIWNLVFTQFNKDRQGNFTKLPKPNIDTGMGLSRTAMIMQNKRTVYDTDEFQSLIRHISQLSGREYGQNEATSHAIRVVAEHSRGVSFLISDGVQPSNEGRGYVLRRILRRAVRYGRKLGLDRPFLGEMVDAVVTKMGSQYPQLIKDKAHIQSVVLAEENRFRETLESGGVILDQIINSKKRSDKTISGKEAFELYATYGFPLDVTIDIASELGFKVDSVAFQKEMEVHAEVSRAGANFGLGDKSPLRYAALTHGHDHHVEFVGYERLREKTRILGMLVNGTLADKASAGQEVEVILQSTPFYAEGGGQVGDSGEIRAPLGRISVIGTQKPVDKLFVHIGRVAEGEIKVGDTVDADVDVIRRHETMSNHTGTHMLHAALRQVLGTHVRQAGSLVEPERLRFDFTHPSAITRQQFMDIERLVNQKTREDLDVHKHEMGYQEAIAHGALAFFGEKYGDRVRVIQIGEHGHAFSTELCGGTHIDRTGEMGILTLLTESSIGSGVRRIEAVTGKGAEDYLETLRAGELEMAQELKTTPHELASKIKGLVAELDSERKRASSLERELARSQADVLLANVQQVKGAKLVSGRINVSSADVLREACDYIKGKIGSGVVVIGALIAERPSFVAMITPDLVKQGFHAGNIVKQVAAVTGGTGGGKPELAQAGGQDAAKLDEALKAAAQFL